MRPYYWLNIVGFLSLLAFFGCLWQFFDQKPVADSSCDDSMAKMLVLPHPFLCGQKIKVNHASVADISQIDGISKNVARDIHRFFKDHPEASIDEALIIRGIGPKTLLRLKKRFYSGPTSL
jgi:hypothetical protein